MGLGMRSAGTGLAAADAPANAVRLLAGCREHLGRQHGPTQRSIAAKSRQSLRAGAPRGTGSMALSTSRWAVELAVATTPLLSGWRSRQSPHPLAVSHQHSAALWRDHVRRASSSTPAGATTLYLITSTMGESDVRCDVGAASPTREREAISRWSPRPVARRSSTGEMSAPIGADARRHRAGQFINEAASGGSQQHRYPIIGRRSPAQQLPRFSQFPQRLYKVVLHASHCKEQAVV
jgi:hypothetical protein